MDPFHEIEGDEEQFIACADEKEGSIVIVVEPKDTADITGDQFMTLSTRHERAVHVHIMTAKVQGDKELEQQCVWWIGRGQIT